jgi:hypothetical protein
MNQKWKIPEQPERRQFLYKNQIKYTIPPSPTHFKVLNNGCHLFHDSDGHGILLLQYYHINIKHVPRKPQPILNWTKEIRPSPLH